MTAQIPEQNGKAWRWPAAGRAGLHAGTAISRLSTGMITRRFSGNVISRLALICSAPIYGASSAHPVSEAIGLQMTISRFLQTATPLLPGFLASGLGSGAMTWALAPGMAASPAPRLARI